ncbi:MAG: glycosyltransferase family 39 protein [Burkholderiaceae bacterium]
MLIHDATLPAQTRPERPKAGLLQAVSNLLDVQSSWVVFAIAFVWFGATTGLYPLLLPDEGRYVGVAWNMLSANDYAVPRLDGLPFFHKPPLFYWLTALSLNVFGVNEWAARLASVLGATLTVTAMFWFLKAQLDRRVAALAAFILMSAPLLFGASHYANLDMTVAGIITATVIAGATAVFRLEQGRAYRACLALTYALAAAGFLAKGLIGVVLPGGILFFWLLGRRRFGTMLRMLWLPGIAIFLLLATPWMVAMQQRYPDFFDYYIVYQHFERFLEKGFNNARPFWFYVPVLLGLTLPWSVHLWRLANKAYWKNPRHAALRGLMLSWLLVVLVFFSLPNSKLVGYILPAVAPLAYFVADIFAARLSVGDGRRALKAYTVSLSISLAICVAAVVAMTGWPQPGSKGLAHKMLASYQPSDKIAMLERFRYDLDFYLGVGKTSFVVSQWDDPELKHTDNWRRELYDAGRFESEAADQLLISPESLVHKLCTDHVVGLWLVGNADSHERYGFLQNMDADIQDGKLRAWHVPAGKPLSFCAGMPKAGRE